MLTYTELTKKYDLERSIAFHLQQDNDELLEIIDDLQQELAWLRNWIKMQKIKMMN